MQGEIIKNCQEHFFQNDWHGKKWKIKNTTNNNKLKIHKYMFTGYLNLNIFPGLISVLNSTFNWALSKFYLNNICFSSLRNQKESTIYNFETLLVQHHHKQPFLCLIQYILYDYTEFNLKNKTVLYNSYEFLN